VEQVRVPLLPLVGLEILLQTAQPAFKISDSRKCRYRAPYCGVYSSSYRGKQRRENQEEQETEPVLMNTGKATTDA
jgi:hypothetical protein